MVVAVINKSLLCLLWVLFLLLSSSAWASSLHSSTVAANDYRFTSLDHEKLDMIGGLWSIAQDSSGFMWFGGENGLARFDGYDVKIYRNSPSQANGLSSSYVRDLLVDSSGQLWIATTFGLNLYKPDTDSFVRYLSDSEDPLSISGNDIRSLAEDDDGSIWVGTGEAGLNRFDPDSEHFQRFLHDEADPKSISSNSIYDLEIDPTGVLWVGTVSKGLNKLVLTPALSDEPSQFVHFKYVEGDRASISSNHIRSVHHDHHGQLWVGTTNGLNRLKPDGRSFKHFFSDIENDHSISSDFVQDIAEDKHGNLWFATSGKGLNFYETETGRFFRYFHNPQDTSSLLNNNIRSLFSASDGNFWLGHFASGVSMLDHYASAFKNFYHNEYLDDTLNHNEITGVIEAENGDLWVGTVAGVNYLNRKTNKVQRYIHDPNDNKTMSDGGVLGFLMDSKQRLWVGLWGSGLNRIDTNTGQIDKYEHAVTDVNSLASKSVWTLLQDSAGRIWIGNHVGGLQYYDESLNHFIDVSTKSHASSSVECNSVFSLFEDSLNNFWVGCSNGLYVRPKGAHDFQRFYHIDGKADSLSANHIWMINEDVQGYIWVGTQGGGVNRYNPVSKTFDVYRAADGMADDLVTGMLQDEKGYIWFSTGRGLSKFDPKLKVFKNYSKGHGLAGNVFNRAALIKTTFNEFVIGSKDGLSIFNPQSIPLNQQPPPVKITEFEIFNKEVPVGTADSPLVQSIFTTKHLSLSYENSSFSFKFSALNYRIPFANHFAYRLEGFEQDWNYVGTRRQAYYTNLDPGEYIFRVKASNNEGVWNELGESINIIIHPPWWDTWWAYIIYLCLIVSIIFLIVQVFLQHKMAESERKVSAQLRTFDKVKDNFLANTSHEIRTPLSGIIGLSESLRDGVAGDLPKEARHYLDMVIVSGKRLSNLVNDILDFSKLRESRISLKKMPVDLYSLTEVVLTLFTPLMKGRPIELKNNISTDLPLVLADENRLQQILYNLVGNAVKFTDEGKIDISAFVDENCICIAISDTGVGISEDKYEAVFNSYEQIENDANYGDLGTGLGLTVTKQLVELHGGTIKVKSVLGEGSCFIFTLPLPKLGSKPLVKPLSAYQDEKGVFENSTNVFSVCPHDPDTIAGTQKQVAGSDFNILVVDDEPVNRLVLEGFLKVKNYRITECGSGQEALDLLAGQNDVALVLLDVMMPRMSGLETCTKIRENYTQNELPVLFLTGRNQRADLEAGYRVGGSDFLTKPVSKEELLSRVEMHLQLADKMRQTD